MQATQRFYMERFNLKRKNDMEIIEKYHVKISKIFVALENLDDKVNINRA
jgi:hypothetical protein